MRLALAAVLCLSSTVFAAAPKRVTFEFVNADVHSVLRIFAEVGRFNLVTSDAVQGKVTLSLRNVPWTEAMNAVLATKGLAADRRDRGNIVRVAPLSELAAEAKQLADLEEAKFNAKPLKVTLIPVNYATAADLVPHVKASLSSRGTVSVDARTNTLIVRDVE